MEWLCLPAARLASSAAAWDIAAKDAFGLAPFLHSRFLVPLLAQFGSGREVIIIGSRSGEARVATVMTPRGNGIWQTFQPSQLPLGAFVARQGENWQEHLTPMLRALPGIAISAGISQIDPALLERTPSGRVSTLDYIQTGYIDIAGSFDDYWGSRGKNLRQNMRKQRNKLAEQGIATRLDVLTSASAVADAIREYGRLETSGWKASIGTAVSPDNPQGRFYRAMLEAYCDAGRGRIYLYRFGDAVVAVDLCILSDDTMVVLKTTYDETNKALSPAFLMREEAMRQVYEEGVIRRIEFYGKLMDWHLRWTEQSRTLYHANIERWNWLSWVRRQVRDRRAAAPAPTDGSTDAHAA